MTGKMGAFNFNFEICLKILHFFDGYKFQVIECQLLSIFQLFSICCNFGKHLAAQNCCPPLFWTIKNRYMSRTEVLQDYPSSSSYVLDLLHFCIGLLKFKMARWIGKMLSIPYVYFAKYIIQLWACSKHLLFINLLDSFIDFSVSSQVIVFSNYISLLGQLT